MRYNALISDTAYANDPRIKNFAEERKQRKIQEKKAKEEALKEKERVDFAFIFLSVLCECLFCCGLDCFGGFLECFVTAISGNENITFLAQT